MTALDYEALLASSGSPEGDSHAPAVAVTFFANDSALGKSFALDGDGALVKATAGAMGSGSYEVCEVCGLAGLSELIESLGPQHALSFGLPRTEARMGSVQAAAKLKRSRGKGATIARDGDHMAWPSGPGVMLIDYDPPDDAEPKTAEELVEELRRAVPELGCVPILSRASAGSCIYHGEREVRGVRGLHLYVLVEGAPRIPQAAKVIDSRLWLAGHGRVFVTKAGTLLCRSLIDSGVYQPHHLDFIRATCAAPLEQRLPPARIHEPTEAPAPGGLLNLAGLALSDAQADEVATLKREAREHPETVERARLQRERWALDRAREQSGDDATEAEIEARAAGFRELPETRDLPGDWELITERGERVTVAELVEEPARWHEVRFHDPLEPDYRDDPRIAVFLYNEAIDTGQIHSHAHGGTNFDLRLAFMAHDFDGMPDSELSPVEMAPRASRGFTLTPLGEFVRLPSPDYLIKGVLPRHALGAIFGPPGSGKSFLVGDMAFCVARGVPWRGQRTRQGHVVYVVAEGQGGLINRARAYLMHHGLEARDIPLDLIAERVPNLTADDEADELIESLSAVRPTLVVVDTLAAVTPGANENTGEDMGAVLARCQRIVRATGGAVLLVHHSGKDATRGQRGWSGLKAAMDLEIEVSRQEIAGNEIRTAKVSKLKDGEDGAEYAFRLASVWLGSDDDGDDITSCVVEHLAETPREPFRPNGKWQIAVWNALDHLAWSDNDGGVLAAELITAAIKDEPTPENGKDRRREYAARALEKLQESGALVEDGGRFRKPA